ncbi:hypothetical protein EVAR_19208_1 [Eumeta japonica]|uniref:Uncharacterized protein n=1 Tax=Eumeta variegata TaxID=151549 RepID=A0A4C1VEP4_EUMVA|nr:hypothetical protein EVAR_19208_1 [Eumeta japonica]
MSSTTGGSTGSAIRPKRLGRIRCTSHQTSLLVGFENSAHLDHNLDAKVQIIHRPSPTRNRGRDEDEQRTMSRMTPPGNHPNTSISNIDSSMARTSCIAPRMMSNWRIMRRMPWH